MSSFLPCWHRSGLSILFLFSLFLFFLFFASYVSFAVNSTDGSHIQASPRKTRKQGGRPEDRASIKAVGYYRNAPRL